MLSCTDPINLEPWRAYAACAHTPSELFYHRSLRRHVLCDGCPVSELCPWAAVALEALADSYRYGRWGGCTPAGRDRIAGSLPVDTDDAELYGAAVGVSPGGCGL